MRSDPQHRAKLMAILWRHNDPLRVPHVEKMLAEHKGREEQFLKSLENEYARRALPRMDAEGAVEGIQERERQLWSTGGFYRGYSSGDLEDEAETLSASDDESLAERGLRGAELWRSAQRRGRVLDAR